MNQIELKALAKINLGLDVLGRRENGYHDVRMVMQSIYLYDEVKIEKTEAPGIALASNLSFLPTGEGNIAYKAAQLLTEEFEIGEGVKITLNKHIPVAAGLAGGSSNAAAVLFGMNRMFRLGLTREELMARGVRLGADVPYCIMRGTVLAEGIGEARPRVLVLDLSELTFTDSSGIAVLLRAQRRMAQTGGSLRVWGTPEQARKVFRAAGLERLIRFEEDGPEGPEHSKTARAAERDDT